MAFSIKKFFGFSESRKKKLPEKFPVFITTGRTMLPRRLVLPIIEAAGENELEEPDETKASPQEALFSSYLELVHEDQEWPVLGFEFSVTDEADARLAPEQWGRFLRKQSGEAAAAARVLTGFLDSGLAIWDGESRTLKCPDFILSQFFPASLLAKAGLPVNSDAYLELFSEGVDFTPSFQMKKCWIRYGHELMAPKRSGMLLKAGTSDTSLMGSVFFVADALDRFSERCYESDVARTAAWAGVASLIRCSPYKSALSAAGGGARIVNAAKLTLEIDKNGDIVPVLLRTKLKRNGGIDSTPLLSPAQMEVLSRKFKSHLPITDYIDLGGRSYATLTPELKKILEAVRRIMQVKGRSAGTAKARLFANSVGAICEELEKTEGESAPILDAVKDIFIETPEFLSQRVLAIGPWQKHEISFATPAITSWFEDGEKHYRFQVGGQWYFWSVEELRSFARSCRKATAKGEDAFVFENEGFSVDDVDLEAIDALLEGIREKTSAESDDKQPAPSEPGTEVEPDEQDGGDGKAQRKKQNPRKEKKEPGLRYGPLIKSNLEVLEYKAKQRQHPDFTIEFSGLAGGMRLYPHQQECLEWLQDLWRRGMPGALLADDMGLGKTLQCLSFIKWLKDNYEALGTPRTALVIAPSGLVENWRKEGWRYFGAGLGSPLVINAGKANALKKMPEQERLGEIAAHRWAITSYETVRDRFQVFSNVDWCMVALDEAQRVKNPNTALADSVKSLEAEFWLAITGTPVENSFLDLWSIMDIVGSGVMGAAKDFARRYMQELSIPEAGRELHDLLAGEGKGPDDVKLMLRRLKKDRLEKLPLKSERKVVKEMPPSQADCYERILAGRKDAQAAGQGRSAALSTLHQLETCSFLGVAELPEDFAFSKEQIAGSARLTAFFEILDEIHRRKEKVLVFLIHKMLLPQLAEAIESRYGMNELPPQVINGSTPFDRREQAVESFMSSPEGRFDVMLLTSRAAGVGLTLTKACNVIHLERWWNPAVEDQCTDRAYRIGQERDVTVYLPIAESPRRDNAFDVVLDNLLEEKRGRSGAILAPDDDGATEGNLCRGVLQR